MCSTVMRSTVITLAELDGKRPYGDGIHVEVHPTMLQQHLQPMPLMCGIRANRLKSAAQVLAAHAQCRRYRVRRRMRTIDACARHREACKLLDRAWLISVAGAKMGAWVGCHGVQPSSKEHAPGMRCKTKHA